jgi:hypothetical protein
MVALGKVVFTSREHIIALEARGKGMVGLTLRYPYEVRKEDEYFDAVEDEKIPKDMLDLAIHIVETKIGHFKPAEFKDQYEDALKDLLRKKQKGEKIERPKEREPSNVINLMDALRQSVKADGKGNNGGSARRPAPAGSRRERASAEKRGQESSALDRAQSRAAQESGMMPGKRVQLDDETWRALDLLGRDQKKDFAELADEAFRDLLKKHGRPVDLKDALRRSAGVAATVHRLQPGKKRRR